jgi:hypothetical protein
MSKSKERIEKLQDNATRPLPSEQKPGGRKERDPNVRKATRAKQ